MVTTNGQKGVTNKIPGLWKEEEDSAKRLPTLAKWSCNLVSNLLATASAIGFFGHRIIGTTPYLNNLLF